MAFLQREEIFLLGLMLVMFLCLHVLLFDHGGTFIGLNDLAEHNVLSDTEAREVYNCYSKHRDWLNEHKRIPIQERDKKWDGFSVSPELETSRCRGYKSRNVKLKETSSIYITFNIVLQSLGSRIVKSKGFHFWHKAKRELDFNKLFPNQVLNFIIVIALVGILLLYAVLVYHFKRNIEPKNITLVVSDHLNGDKENIGLLSRDINSVKITLKKQESYVAKLRASQWLIEGRYITESSTAKRLRTKCPPYYFNQFHRNQSFFQTYIVSPAVNLLSHFASGAFQGPGPGHEMNKEGVRIASYHTFPLSIPVSTLRLAQAGFYYTGDGDKVKCFSCGVTYQGWKQGDRPQVIHATISPTCSLVTGQDSSNVMLPSAMTTRPDFSQPLNFDSGHKSQDSGENRRLSENEFLQHDGCDASDSKSSTVPSSMLPSSYITPGIISPPSLSTVNAVRQVTAPLRSAVPSTSAGTPGVPVSASANGPHYPSSQACPDSSHLTTSRTYLLPMKRLDLGGTVYPQYSLMDARRKSFENWKHITGLPNVEDLVALGFFYAGYADCVRCFYCGIGLKSWEPGDDPAKVHAKWRPNCGYIRLVKGDDFVDNVTGGRSGSAVLTTIQTNSTANGMERGSESLLSVLEDTSHSETSQSNTDWTSAK